MVNVHARYLDVLETEGWLDRGLEFLPTDKQIAERQAAGGGLTTPEFAVLIAYTKNANIAEMVRTDLPDDPYLEADLVDYFPTPLRERYRDGDPPATALRREIIATADRQPDGQPVGHLVRQPHDGGHRRRCRRRDRGRGWWRATCFDFPALWERDRRARRRSVKLDTQLDLFLDCRRMVERGALWLLRHRRPPLDIAATVAEFRPGIAELARDARGAAARPDGRRRDRSSEASRLAAGVPEDLAERAGAVAAAAHRLRRHRAGRRAPAHAARRAGRRVLGGVRRARPGVAVGRRSARCRAPTAGRRRPARRCATTCCRRSPS